LTVTNTSTGCTNNDAVIITVNPLPTANAGADKSICTGGFTSIGSTSVTGMTYAWTSSPSGFTSTSANPSINPTVSTSYFVTVTNTSTGCINRDTVVITVNPLPTANAGADKTICNGASTSIGASAVTGNTYSWTSSPTGFTSTSANPSINPSASTTYFVTVTNTSTGCVNRDTVVITVNPLPTANAGGDKTICNGASISMGASAVTGNTYAWTSSPSGFTNTTANHLLLKDISNRNNGVMVLPNNMMSLSDLIRKREDVKSISHSEISLNEMINIKWLFFVILSLLSIEWFLRKRNGSY
jgi:hypothetical protein